MLKNISTIFLVILLIKVSFAQSSNWPVHTNVFDIATDRWIDDSGNPQVYFCIKIPSLTATYDDSQIVTAEARVGSCSDFAETHIVIKKSTDRGKTWGSQKIISKDKKNTMNQACPVQLKNKRKILLPFNKNNKECFIIESTDDGDTWSDPRQITPCMEDNWAWVGFGPPASLQQESGRIIIPSYHTYFVKNILLNFFLKYDSNLTYGHVMISDDEGQNWRFSKNHSYVNLNPIATKGNWTKFPPALFPQMPNEGQAVDLGNNRVQISHRNSIGLRRVQVFSNDGGDTFGDVEVVNIPEPITGVQGSIWRSKNTKKLYQVAPVSLTFLFRKNMWVYESDDEGKTWNKIIKVRDGEAGYTAFGEVEGKLILVQETEQKQDLLIKPDKIEFINLGIDV